MISKINIFSLTFDISLDQRNHTRFKSKFHNLNIYFKFFFLGVREERSRPRNKRVNSTNS